MNESRVKITDPEQTLLDGLMAPQYCGDFAEVLHAFEVHAPKIDLERIIRHALKLDAATVKRLGWILERRREWHPPDWTRRVRCVLDPTGPHRGPG